MPPRERHWTMCPLGKQTTRRNVGANAGAAPVEPGVTHAQSQQSTAGGTIVIIGPKEGSEICCCVPSPTGRDPTSSCEVDRDIGRSSSIVDHEVEGGRMGRGGTRWGAFCAPCTIRDAGEGGPTSCASRLRGLCARSPRAGRFPMTGKVSSPVAPSLMLPMALISPASFLMSAILTRTWDLLSITKPPWSVNWGGVAEIDCPNRSSHPMCSPALGRWATCPPRKPARPGCSVAAFWVGSGQKRCPQWPTDRTAAAIPLPAARAWTLASAAHCRRGCRQMEVGLAPENRQP